MNIVVTAKTRAKENRVEKIDDGHYRVFVKEMPVAGRANNAIIAVLADYFDVPKAHITLKIGKTSKEKLFTIKFDTKI